MLKLKFGKNFYRITLLILQLAVLVGVICTLVPLDGDNFWVPVCCPLVVLIVYYFLIALSNNKYYQIEYYLKDKSLKTNETHFISCFIDRIRSCYSYDDFFAAISEVMEQQANCSVIYEDCVKNTVLYQSPNHLTTNQNVLTVLNANYPETWQEGCFFISDNFDRSSYADKARGFFLSADSCHLYVFCKYTRLLNAGIYKQLFEEFVRFQNRMKIMNQLTEKERLSHDWNHLREIRNSFLQLKVKDFGMLHVESSYDLDVDEACSFYSVIPLSKDETLIVFGDTQKKGFMSLLAMCFALNAVQTSEQKRSLPSLASSVDKALSSAAMDSMAMLFGLVNTASLTFTFLNAGIQTALNVNHAQRKVVRLKPEHALLSECVHARQTPAVQDIEDESLLLMTSNCTVCRSPEFVSKVFNASRNVSGEALLELKRYVEASAASENITLLSAKIR